jgi:hypothetical protein
MKNTQKGFAVPLVILIIVLLIAGGTYVILRNKSKNQISRTPITNQNTIVRTSDGTIATIPGKGASYVAEKGRIQVLSPKEGENVQAGTVFDIQWTNYKGQEPLTISLQTTSSDNKISTKIIASDIPATSNSYKWTISEEDYKNKYRIEIYPAGGREYVGFSKGFFKISR